MQAEAARKAFTRGATGDHLSLARVFDQWVEAGATRQWCSENFVQFRSMRRARDIRDQLEGLCDRVEIPVGDLRWDLVAVTRAITAGFFYHAAKRQPSGSYRTIQKRQLVRLHPSSCLAPKPVKKDKDGKVSEADEREGAPPPEWVIYHELVHTSEQFMRQVQEVDPKWLIQVAPHVYSQSMLQEAEEEKAAKRHEKAARKGKQGAATGGAGK